MTQVLHLCKTAPTCPTRTRGLGTRLRQSGPGGGELPFGGTWTVLIVMQIAVMAIVPTSHSKPRRSPQTTVRRALRIQPLDALYHARQGASRHRR